VTPTASHIAASTNQRIAALWQRNQPLVLERLALLDLAAADASSAALSPALREEAAAIAHKLAGSLGMFGFPEGTHLARELEQSLGFADPDAASLTRLTQALRHSLFPGQP